MSQITRLGAGGGGGGGTVTTLDGNTGTATPIAGVVNIIGTGAISTSGSGNTLTISESGSVATTYDGNSGSATPAAGILNVIGVNNVTTTASGSTIDFSVTGTTQHAVLIGNASGSLTSIAVGTTNTVLLGSTAADPSFGQVPNAALVNSSITLTAGSGISISGSPVSLGGTATISSNSIAPNYTAVSSSPYLVLTNDYFLGVNSSGGAITIELPNAPTARTTFIIKDSTGSAVSHNITVTTVGGIVDIDGATSLVMNTAYEAVSVFFDGTTYQVY